MAAQTSIILIQTERGEELLHILEKFKLEEKETNNYALDSNNERVKEVSMLLHDIGIPANICGYRYLRDSITMVLEDPASIHGITKIIYPEVAKLNNTTSSRVERSIRHAIEVAFSRGDIDVIYDIFSHSVCAKSGRPTNSEFIATVADYMVVKYRRE